MLNMEYSDCFYMISYPKYSGFKVEHDPTYTAYASLEPLSAEAPKTFGLILIGGIVAAVIIGAVLVTRRRKPKTQALETSTLPVPLTPTIPATT
jgi:hypothetical protein